MQEKYNISIVIVEYHSLCDLQKCISSILDQNILGECEFIISSNSCYAKNEQERILAQYPNYIWLFNDFNGGFAYAMNKGLKIAKGDFLIILNPDSLIKSGFNDMLVFMNKHTDVGAIGPQIMDPNGNIQDSFREYLTVQNFLYRHIKRLLLKKDIIWDDYDKSKIQTVDWIIGAFILVRRDVYERIGGLDSGYFLYCEDLDWCTRIVRSGYKVVYYPKMKIEYMGSRTARQSIKYTKIFLKSLLRYWRKFGFFLINRQPYYIFEE
jgi:GT2 family glycosyltransferase